MDAFLQLKGLVAEGRDWRENSEDEPGSIDEATMLGADAMVARAGKGTV